MFGLGNLLGGKRKAQGYRRPASRIEPQAPKALRRFDIGTPRHLFKDWRPSEWSINVDIRDQLQRMRAMSRDLDLNQRWARRIFELYEENIVGPQGMKLQVRMRRRDGTLMEALNTAVEQSFMRWSRYGTPTVCGQYSFVELESLAVRQTARDGDLYLAKVIGGEAENPWNFALQVIEGDHLDHRLWGTIGDLSVRNGVGFDARGRRQRYYMLEDLSESGAAYYGNRGAHREVPAEQIIPLFMRERHIQARGYPWLAATGGDLKQIREYAFAALVAARAGASKGGYYKQESPGAYGDDPDNFGRANEDSQYQKDLDALPQEITPLMNEILPPGVDFVPNNPDYPHGNYQAYMETELQGAAVGGGVSYAALTGDLSSANYSSLRAGENMQRDTWRRKQRWWRTAFSWQVYDPWLEMALLSGQIPGATISMMEDILEASEWQPRGWQWVDPLKEQQANTIGLENGDTTLRDICAARGQDWREQLDQRAVEIAYARDVLGLDPATAAINIVAAVAAEE